MNPLQNRLAALRRRLRLQIGWRGLCALTGMVVGSALLAGLADWFLDLPSLIRAFLLVVILGSAGLLAYLEKAKKLTKKQLAQIDEETLKNAAQFAMRAAAVTVSRAGADPPWAAEMK